MAKTLTLRFRAVDKKNFDEIRDGLKTIETRAASDRYQDIHAGDTLNFVCGKQKLKRRVARIRHFKSIAGMFKAIPLRKVFPSGQSITDARKIYYSYPGYKEKIERFGIIAMELEK